MNNFISHILVVDDDDGIRTLVKKDLNENNFLVTTANSAEDAAEKVKVIKFDLIILDIMMPGKSGLEFIEENKKLSTPVILLTAKGEANERIKGLRLGLMIIYQNHLNQENLFLELKKLLKKQIKTIKKRL